MDGKKMGFQKCSCTNLLGFLVILLNSVSRTVMEVHEGTLANSTFGPTILKIEEKICS